MATPDPTPKVASLDEVWWPIHWDRAVTRLAALSPGPAADEIIDALTDEVLVTGAGPEALPVLIRGLSLAQGSLTRRAVALTLAASAPGTDRAVVDALLAAYDAAVADAFLGPALLEALGLLAAKGGLARAAVVAELFRLDRTAGRYLLVKAAKVAGRLDAVRPEPDLRDQLREWSQADDLAVQGECRHQLALTLLADALLATARESLGEGLADARAAFAGAEATEEHRPDAALFRHMLDMLLGLLDLASDPAAAAARAAEGADAVRHLVTKLGRHDWHGYRSARDEVIAARVLATAEALERAAASATGADVWVRLDEALEELAAWYTTVRDDAGTLGDSRLDAALSAVADRVLAPALGPVLRGAVGRTRLQTIVQRHAAQHGDDHPVTRGLTALVREAGGDEPEPLSTEDANYLNHLATHAGLTAQALIAGLCEAVKKDEVNDWARSLGLPPATLPIDLPGLYDNDPAVNEAVRDLLKILRKRLGSSFGRRTWDALAAALQSVVRFCRHARDNLPAYMLCAEDGGKGREATEQDLQDHLFQWLDLQFGRGATYEHTKVGGGRSDAGLSLCGCTFPIEVKHEFRDVSPLHIRKNYLVQSDIYAVARDGIAFLLVLDLRDTHSAGHQTRVRKRRRSGVGPEPVSLYSLREGFWVDGLPSDPQIDGAMDKPIIVGLFPGNRPRPSSTTEYSRRRHWETP